MQGGGGIYGMELIGLCKISSNQVQGVIRSMDQWKISDWANGYLGMACVKVNIRVLALVYEFRTAGNK